MSIHLIHEIEKLKNLIYEQILDVKNSMNDSLAALVNRDKNKAESVIKSDEKIDEKDIEIEEECLKILALHQPVASDLRFIIAVLKLNNDLQRIADLSVSIAETAINLLDKNKIDFLYDVNAMGQEVKNMVDLSHNALINLDAEIATKVIDLDNKVDEMHLNNYVLFSNHIKKQNKNVDEHLFSLRVSRNLERIADHATYIAEHVVYMIKGKIIRHHSE